MRLKTPSLRAVVAEARASAMRFPGVLAASVACGAVAVGLLQESATGRGEVLLSLSLTISLAFAMACFGEQRGWGVTARSAAFLAVLALAGLHYLSLSWQTEPQWTLRFFQLSLAAHLLVAFLPYVGGGPDRGFWEFNQSLFTRFVTAVFFSVVLFAGVSVAALAARSLLGVEVPQSFYWRLWIGVVFGFNTWFFLAGVPMPLPASASPEGRPRELRLLVQYILIPLVTIYLLILYAYMLKLGLERSWPQGRVGYLVLSFSLLGILSLLLIHPYQEIEESRWTKRYARVFYLALFPLVALLLAAAWRRIDEYGLTERRYLLVMLGLWLGGIAAYFTLSRWRDIRVVPISAFALALLTAVGPLSAHSVARWDQLRRLTELLEAHDILRQERVRRAPETVDPKVEAEVSGILFYLNRVHDGAGVDEWFEPGSLERDGSHRPDPAVRTTAMMNAMGLRYVPPEKRRGEENLYMRAAWISGRAGPAIPTADFDGLLYFMLVPDSHWSQAKTTWKGERFVVALEEDGTRMVVTCAGASISIPIDTVLADLVEKHGRHAEKLPFGELSYSGEEGPLRVQVVFEQILGSTRHGDYRARNLKGFILFALSK